MTKALRILHGNFGRVALLDMDSSLIAHAHSQCHVVIKVSGADTSFAVGGREYPLTDRTAVLVNAWEPHYYRHRESSERTVFLALYIEPAWLAAIERSLAISGTPHFFRRPFIELSRPMCRLLDALLIDMVADIDIPSDRLETLLFDLLIAIVESFTEWRSAPMVATSADPRIERAVGYLREHVGTPLDMGEVAGQANLSRPHFFSLFRRDMQMTPNVFVNMLRMERACSHLVDRPNGTLGRLSTELGFTRQHHFTRFFRQHQGVTPGAYHRTVQVFSPASAS